MAVALRLVVREDDGRARSIEVMKLDCGLDLSDSGKVGLSLAQAKTILSRLQEAVVAAQARAHAGRSRSCRRCGQRCHIKDRRTRQIDTFFGRVALDLVRFACSACRHLDAGIDWPPHRRSTPELDQTRAHLSALTSYRSAIDILTAVFPINAGAAVETLRRHTLRVGETLAAAPVEKATAPPSSITVGIDSTFIRSCNAAEQRHLEVYVGNIESGCGTRHVFGAVAGGHPGIKAALQRALEAAGRVEGSTVTAFSDGDPYLRNVLRSSGIGEKPILDWFHIGMRLQHLATARPGADRGGDRAAPLATVAWQGQERPQGHRCDPRRDARLQRRAATSDTVAVPPSLERPVRIRPIRQRQSGWTINYAARHRAGLRVGTALTEGATNYLVNRRMNKAQQMRWSIRGANLLLQVRCAVYSGTLDTPIAAAMHADTDATLVLPEAA